MRSIEDIVVHQVGSVETILLRISSRRTWHLYNKKLNFRVFHNVTHTVILYWVKVVSPEIPQFRCMGFVWFQTQRQNHQI